jgi:hypothetical protein
MCRFIEVKGWHHQTKEYDVVVNIEHMTRIAANDEGRAVVHFVDGGAVTMAQPYRDFVRLLDSLEKIESSWRTAGDTA